MNTELKINKKVDKFLLPDLSGKNNHLHISTKFDGRKKLFGIKMRIGKQEAIINKDYLIGVLFSLVDSEDYKDKLTKLVSSEEKDVLYQRKLVTIKATKDIKEGESIVIEVDVPVSINNRPLQDVKKEEK